MKYFFIMNPGSKGGNSRKKIQRIMKILGNSNINYEYKITRSIEDAYTLSLEVNKKDYDVIAVVGGDGTINRVINGFFDVYGKRISNSKFGVIYTGTSPDFCKSNNIPIKIDDAVNVLLLGKSKKIQIGQIKHACYFDKTLDGQPLPGNNSNVNTSYFACCANIGLGASLARNANSGIRKVIGDYAGTFISLIKVLISYRYSDFTVLFDGKKQILEKVYNIAVGKTTFIASGIKVKNNLQSEDKLFYSLIVKNIRLFNLAGIFKKIYSGKEIVNDDHVLLQYAKSIEVYGNNDNPELEFDGDPMGFLPCIIQAAKDPLDLICEV